MALSCSRFAVAALAVFSLACAKDEAVLSFSGEESSLLLIQHQSHVDNGKKSDKELPNVSTVLNKPNQILDKMASHVDTLEARLGAFEHDAARKLAKQRNAYEKNLTTEHKENQAVHDFNSKLSTEIAELEARNANLRKQADDLLKQNSALTASLQSLQGNMSMAEEFASIGLNRSSEMLETAPEVQVLNQLFEEEQNRSTQTAHKRALEMISGGKHMSAMQIGALLLGPGKGHSAVSGDDEGEDAQGLLKLMSGALTELQDQQKAGEEALRAQFEKEYADALEHRAKLLSKQAELNGTKADALELQARLTEAVEHVQKANSYLQKQIDALRNFAHRLGQEDSSNKGMSLLQTASHAPLPNVRKVLYEPSQALDTVNSHVSELQNRLAKIQEQGNDEVRSQKIEYDRQLAQLSSNISHQQLENAKVQADIEELDQSIASLRLQAARMVAHNHELRNDLKMIQANISIAQEYLSQLLNDTHEPVAHTKDLKILKELDDLDAVENDKQAHEASLKAVSKISLLQVQDGSIMQQGGSPPAQDILSSLGSSMEMLVAEQNASLARLRSEFDKELHEGKKVLHKLVHHWDKLNETRANKTLIKHEVEVAVEHLDRTGKSLEKRRTALLNFAGKLAAMPHPIGPDSLTEASLSAPSQHSVHGLSATTFQKAYDVFKNVSTFISRTDVDKIKKAAHDKLAEVREKWR